MSKNGKKYQKCQKMAIIKRDGDNMGRNDRDFLTKINDMNMMELKEFVKRHDIDATDCRVKKDYIHAIAGSRKFTDLTSHTIKVIAKDNELQIKDLANEIRKFDVPAEDRLIAQAKDLYTNFKESEHLLAHLKVQFHDDDHKNVIRSADKTLMCAEKSLAEFQTTVFSYVVLSAQHILESWMKVGVNVDEAANSLLQAKRAIKGDFKKKSKVMNELFKQMEMVYERQAKNAKKRIASARSLINEVMSMGASTKYAESLLTKARESLLNKNYSEFFEYINKAENDAKASMDRRLKAIEDSIPAVKTIIDDAKGIGADVEEAEKLFNRADLAFKSGDHLLCVELTRRSEEKAIKAQEEQIQRAIRLRRGQIQKTSEMILGFQNIIAKAKSLNIDISKAKDLLNEVNIALQKKEYVKIVKYRRSIERTMRDFESEIEVFAKTQKKPEGGVCKKCKSKDLKFFNNGWGKCLNCEWKFQWLFPDKT